MQPLNKDCVSNDTSAIQQLDEIASASRAFSAPLSTTSTRSVAGWLPASRRVAGEHRHIVVRVVEEPQQVHYRSPLQIGDVHRLLQHRIAKPAAQQLGGEIDLGRLPWRATPGASPNALRQPVKQLMNFSVTWLYPAGRACSHCANVPSAGNLWTDSGQYRAGRELPDEALPAGCTGRGRAARRRAWALGPAVVSTHQDPPRLREALSQARDQVQARGPPGGSEVDFQRVLVIASSDDGLRDSVFRRAVAGDTGPGGSAVAAADPAGA